VGEIDSWFSRKATKWTGQNRTKVFIATNAGNNNAMGFYSVSFSTEDSNKLSGGDERDIWRDGVPLLYIGYLGVHSKCQNCGIGKFLLIDALRRAHLISKHVAFYGVGLRSLNAQTTKLYSSFGFGVAQNEDSNPLMILPVWTLGDLFD